jgi:prolyl-tRNA editing enzyme YbaK/EbsC (Cys-tRNA(Pro) deacylase)
MSLDTVRLFLATHAPDIAILEMPTSTATVVEAAQAHGVAPGQIAKTLSLWCRDEVMVLVLTGDARIDNARFKARFQTKARMLSADEVLHWTGHPVGGVCPFGLAHPLRVYADVSLRRFETVLPAAGATHAAVCLAPDRLVALVGAEWVDVAQPLAP